MTAQDGKPTPRPAPERALWLLSPASTTGRFKIDASQYEELRAEARALLLEALNARQDAVEALRSVLCSRREAPEGDHTRGVASVPASAWDIVCKDRDEWKRKAVALETSLREAREAFEALADANDSAVPTGSRQQLSLLDLAPRCDGFLDEERNRHHCLDRATRFATPAAGLLLRACAFCAGEQPGLAWQEFEVRVSAPKREDADRAGTAPVVPATHEADAAAGNAGGNPPEIPEGSSVAKCQRCKLPFPKPDESPIGRALCACNLDLLTGLRVPE
ncbi:MAG TPA: hypothetical protein VGI39_17990 [Polyangiaceae bacterium]|jgi:hypothetical protein